MRAGLMVGVLIVTGVAVNARLAAVGSPAEQVSRLLEGESLFQAFCATCHGRDGKGNGPTAQALKTPPADLTRIAQRNGGTFPQDRLEQFIANGSPVTPSHGSKDMPVWGPNFFALAPASDKRVNQRIADVVQYIKSIQVK